MKSRKLPRRSLQTACTGNEKYVRKFGRETFRKFATPKCEIIRQFVTEFLASGLREQEVMEVAHNLVQWLEQVLILAAPNPQTLSPERKLDRTEKQLFPSDLYKMSDISAYEDDLTYAAKKALFNKVRNKTRRMM
jgi:hypothetical protein